MDTARWPQEIVMKPLEEIVPSSKNNNNNNNNQLSNSSSLERKVRPQKEEAVNCPRCNSINTKFCYYNNYSLSQPRFFCKTCKRYWTQGGSLRNIPIGGASRAKNKRSSSSSSSSKKLPDHLVLPNHSITTTTTTGGGGGGATTNNNNNSCHGNPKIYQGQDLNLGFPITHDLKTISQLIQVPNFDHNSSSSAMELLNGISSSSSRGYQLMNSFMPMPVSDPSTMYSSGFSLQDLKPNLNFTLDHTSCIGDDHHHSGGGGGYGDLHQDQHHHHEEVQENNNNNSSSSSSTGKILFPFEDLKQVSSGGTSNSMDQQNRDQQQQQQQGDSTGYWNGVLGSGSW